MFNWGTWKKAEIINWEKPVNDETSGGGARLLTSNSTVE